DRSTSCNQASTIQRSWKSTDVTTLNRNRCKRCGERRLCRISCVDHRCPGSTYIAAQICYCISPGHNKRTRTTATIITHLYGQLSSEERRVGKDCRLCR